MPSRKGKGGGRIRRAFARAKSRARIAAQSAKERVKQAPRNIGELIKVYGRTALLTYIAVDVCTYVFHIYSFGLSPSRLVFAFDHLRN